MKTFYALFGGSYFHPQTGQNLKHSYVEIKAATLDDAEAQMWEAFGARWSDVVDELPARPHGPPPPGALETWEASILKPMDSIWGAWLSPVPFPAPAVAVAGETVTLRVRVSDGAAQEKSLWVAGRCLAERAGAGCAVEHGEGVWLENNRWPAEWGSRNTSALLGVGEVLEVRYVPVERARQAAAADPENVSIVEGSESLGRLGKQPDDNCLDVSGTFTREALDALSGAGDAYRRLVTAAREEWNRAEELKTWRDTVVAVELHKGKVVGVRMKSR